MCRVQEIFNLQLQDGSCCRNTIQQVAQGQSVRSHSWDKLMCKGNEICDLVPRRILFCDPYFMEEMFLRPLSKFIVICQKVNGDEIAGCQKKVQRFCKYSRQTSMKRYRVEGRECNMSGETCFGKHDESKFENLSTALGLFMCLQMVDLYSDIFFSFGMMGNIYDNVRVIRLRTTRAQHDK